MSGFSSPSRAGPFNLMLESAGGEYHQKVRYSQRRMRVLKRVSGIMIVDGFLVLEQRSAHIVGRSHK